MYILLVTIYHRLILSLSFIRVIMIFFYGIDGLDNNKKSIVHIFKKQKQLANHIRC